MTRARLKQTIKALAEKIQRKSWRRKHAPTVNGVDKQSAGELKVPQYGTLRQSK